MMSLLSKIFVPLMILCAIILIVLLQFGFIFLLMAMMPSIMIYFIDFTPSKPIFKTVCISNMAATIPWLVPILHASIKMKHYDITSIMSNSHVWLLIYGGAAGGWCMIFLCRYIAEFIITIQCEYQVNALENFQVRLVNEWGQKIHQNGPQATPPSDE